MKLFQQRKTLASLVAVWALAAASAVSASDMTFCMSDSCKWAKIDNGSMAVVKKATVKQLSDGTATCPEVEKIHKANLGNFKVQMDTRCSYHIKFKTTDGCTGKKHGTVTPAKLAEDRKNVALTGACGSLEVHITTPPRLLDD